MSTNYTKCNCKVLLHYSVVVAVFRKYNAISDVGFCTVFPTRLKDIAISKCTVWTTVRSNHTVPSITITYGSIHFPDGKLNIYRTFFKHYQFLDNFHFRITRRSQNATVTILANFFGRDFRVTRLR